MAAVSPSSLAQALSIHDTSTLQLAESLYERAKKGPHDDRPQDTHLAAAAVYIAAHAQFMDQPGAEGEDSKGDTEGGGKGGKKGNNNNNNNKGNSNKKKGNSNNNKKGGEEEGVVDMEVEETQSTQSSSSSSLKSSNARTPLSRSPSNLSLASYGAGGPGFSVSQLIREAGMGLMDFFGAVKAMVHILSLDGEFDARLKILERSFVVVTILFRKYSEVWDASFADSPHATKKSPLFRLGWVLFLLAQAQVLGSPPDLLHSYFLLLAVVATLSSQTRPGSDDRESVLAALGVANNVDEIDTLTALARSSMYPVVDAMLSRWMDEANVPSLKDLNGREDSHNDAIDAVASRASSEYDVFHLTAGGLDERGFLHNDPAIMMTNPSSSSSSSGSTAPGSASSSKGEGSGSSSVTGLGKKRKPPMSARLSTASRRFYAITPPGAQGHSSGSRHGHSSTAEGGERSSGGARRALDVSHGETPAQSLRAAAARSPSLKSSALNYPTGLAPRSPHNMQSSASTSLPGSPSGSHVRSEREKGPAPPVSAASKLALFAVGGGEGRSSGGSNNPPETPLTAAQSLMRWLRSSFRSQVGEDGSATPPANLVAFVESASDPSVTMEVIRTRASAASSFLPLGGAHPSRANPRAPLAVSLYYAVLTQLLEGEQARLGVSDFSTLLKSDPFHVALLAVSFEVAIFTFKASHLAFPNVLHALALDPFHMAKVLDSFLAVAENSLNLPSGNVYHLMGVEESLLELQLWLSPLFRKFLEPGSRYGDSVASVVEAESARLLNTFGSRPPFRRPSELYAPSPRKFAASPRKRSARTSLFQGVPATAGGEAAPMSTTSTTETSSTTVTATSSSTTSSTTTAATTATTSSPSSSKSGTCLSIEMMTRKVLSLLFRRLSALCTRLSIPRSVMEQCWETLTHILVHARELLWGRHLDVILIATVYGVARVNSLTLYTFKVIIEQYRAQPQASSRVYKSVMLDEGTGAKGDVIGFYNKVFIAVLKPFLLDLQGKAEKKAQAEASAAAAATSSSSAPGRRSGTALPPASPAPSSAGQRVGSQNVFLSPMRSRSPRVAGGSRARTLGSSVSARYNFGLSPAKRLHEINESLRPSPTGKKRRRPTGVSSPSTSISLSTSNSAGTSGTDDSQHTDDAVMLAALSSSRPAKKKKGLTAGKK